MQFRTLGEKESRSAVFPRHGRHRDSSERVAACYSRTISASCLRPRSTVRASNTSARPTKWPRWKTFLDRQGRGTSPWWWPPPSGADLAMAFLTGTRKWAMFFDGGVPRIGNEAPEHPGPLPVPGHQELLTGPRAGP